MCARNPPQAHFESLNDSKVYFPNVFWTMHYVFALTKDTFGGKEALSYTFYCHFFQKAIYHNKASGMALVISS